MRDYNVIEAIFLSFFSPKLYRNVANNWGGKAVFYLLIVVSLSWIAFTFRVEHAIKFLYANNSNQIVAQIPEMTIKNGIITTPQNRPYFVFSPDKKTLLAVIDTSGRFATLQSAKSMVLVTPTTVYSENDPKNPSDIRERQIPNNINMVVNPITINNQIVHFIPFAWIFIFAACVVGGFLYRFIQVFVYALIGKVVGAIFKLRLTYMQIVQIAMVSVTPVLAVSMLFDIINIRLAHESWFFFILAMSYLFFGMAANSGE